MAEEKEIIEEISLETMPLMDEEIQGDDVIPPAAVPKEIKHVNMRRYSTGTLDKRGPGKAQVQTRYRGNQMSSTHDLCKHGKRREDDLVIKPWKLVKQKNVESGDLVKGETLGLTRKSLGNVSKPEKSFQVAKRDAAAAVASEIVKSCDDLLVKRSETKSTSPSDSAVVRKVKKANLDVKKAVSENKISKVHLLKSVKNKEKTTIDEPVRCDDVLEKGVSRISKNKNSKDDLLTRMKNKEKTEIDEPFRCKNVSEKTLYVVESSIEEKKMKKKNIKSVKSEIQQISEEKISRGSVKKSLTLLPSLLPSPEEVKGSRTTRSDPRHVRQTTSRSKTGFSEKKEIGSVTLVTNLKTESKIRPKRIGLKVTPPLGPPTRPLSFKKGKVLEPKPEDSTPTLLKFKKRDVQESKLRSDVNKKKNLKDKREGSGKISNNNGEGKREKVVLRHRKVEAKKKLQTLFNNVIEETVNKLEEVRKSKVKALVGAFETVISLQDDNTKTSQTKKIHSKFTASEVVEG